MDHSSNNGQNIKTDNIINSLCYKKLDSILKLLQTEIRKYLRTRCTKTTKFKIAKYGLKKLEKRDRLVTC